MASTREPQLTSEGVTITTEHSKISVTFLPGGIIKIGDTKYSEEFFLAIDNPDPTKLYRMIRKDGITFVTEEKSDVAV